MPTLVSRVEDSFQISGRCIIVPGIPAGSDLANEFGRDEIAIVLKRPDGSELETTAHIDWPNVRPTIAYPLMLGVEVKSAMVPKGTEVWTKDRSDSAPAA